MAIKIVTDSTADLPQALAEKLGISVIPLYIQFGNKTYRDRVDISEGEFYDKLLNFPVHPTTSQPSPQDFAGIYKDLSSDADGIISIHIASKLSGTCNSAILGKEMASVKCPIEVIDSESVSMGIGLLALEAAKIAASGRSFQFVAEEIRQLVPEGHLWALFDTLKYLAMGGRIGKAKALVGSILNIKPLLVLKESEFSPAAQARSRDKGIDLLYGFASKAGDIGDLAVMYSTTPDEAKALADRLGAVFERSRIKISRLGPALGVHAGPGALAIALRSS
jgi:DegV family protein with EDD domain